MKPEGSVVKLLLFAEAVFLAVVLVFGVVHKIRTAGAQTASVQETEEAAETQWQMSAVSGDADTDTAAAASDVENGMTAAGGESAIEAELSAEVKEKLASMTLEEKVAQMFLTTPESLTQNEQVNIAGAGTRSAMNEYPVGGLIYSDANYQGRGQMSDLLFLGEQMMHERIGLYLFLAADMTGADGTSAVAIGDNYEPDALVEIFTAGWLSEESAGAAMPLVFPEQSEAAVSDAAWVMLSAEHDAQAAGEENLPCALSAKCVETVRTAGYQGIILTDSLSSDNIADSYPVKDAAVLAVQAGADMLYCPENFPDAYAAVLAAVQEGEITESRIDAAVGRILTKKYQIPEPAARQEEPEQEVPQAQAVQQEEPEQQENIPEEQTAQQAEADDNNSANQ